MNYDELTKKYGRLAIKVGAIFMEVFGGGPDRHAKQVQLFMEQYVLEMAQGPLSSIEELTSDDQKRQWKLELLRRCYTPREAVSLNFEDYLLRLLVAFERRGIWDLVLKQH